MSDYFYRKLVQAYVFNSENAKTLESHDMDRLIFTEKFKNALIEFIKYLSENKYLEDEYKENLYIILNYMRLNIEDLDAKDKKRYFIFINYYISVVREASGKEIDTFFEEEVKKRMHRSPLILINDSEKLNQLRETILESIGYDYIIINCILSGDCQVVFPNLLAFFYSLRCILREQPQILNNDNYFSEIKELVEKQLKSFDLNNINFLEKINLKKQYKTIINMLGF